MFKLAHRLRKCSTLLTNKIVFWNANIGVEHFAEVTVGGHVLNWSNINSWRVHRHDDFADASVWRAIVTGSANEIAVVGYFAKTCPDLLTVDDPFIAIKLGKRFQRCKVAARVWFAHANTPRCFSGEHVGEECILLRCSSIRNECWTHLSVCKPRSRNWCTSRNHFLCDDQSFNSRATAATEFGWPCHADPSMTSKLLRELFGVAVHPCVVEAPVAGNCIMGNSSRLIAKRNVLWRPVKIHRQMVRGCGCLAGGERCN